MKTSISLLIILLGVSARSASAQAADQMPNFDLLKAAHGTDSLRRITARQQSELARLARASEAKSDTIGRQRRELVALRAMRDTITRSAPRPASHDTARAAAAPVAVVATVVAPAMTAVKPAAVVQVSPSAAAPAVAPTRAPFPSSPVLSGLIQFWLTGANAGFHNTYRLRRAEVKASGAASPLLNWSVMLDLAKALSATSTTLPNGALQTSVAQGGRALQDAMLSYQARPAFRVDVGQQKIPFGLEGVQSSSTLETVERALFASDRARGGSFGDVRDIGVAVRGQWTSRVDYQVGTFNGSGESQNDVDANSAKALVAHVAIRPWTGLQLGASGVYAGSSAGDAPRRDRDGVDLRFRGDKVLIQAEGVSGHDGTLSRRGMYAHAGYRVEPTFDVHARFDAWDPDVDREADAASATERDYLTGVTWTVPGAGLKVQADVARRTWSAALAPSRWQFLMNLQTSW